MSGSNLRLCEAAAVGCQGAYNRPPPVRAIAVESVPFNTSRPDSASVMEARPFVFSPAKRPVNVVGVGPTLRDVYTDKNNRSHLCCRLYTATSASAS
jgi:hypothetical protein